MNIPPVHEELRVLFAAAALTGLLADPEDRNSERLPGESCAQATARIALEHADALIQQLNLD